MNRNNLVLIAASLLVVALWLSPGADASTNPQSSFGRVGSAGILDIGILVFREGLECILVLAAITASLTRTKRGHAKSIATGVGLGFVATLATWFVAIRVLDDLSKHLSALQLQVWTGLLAIVVLLVVMNWFFHKFYWTGWISLHNRRKDWLLRDASQRDISRPGRKVFWGLALLGFSSFYREGVEVVLFLQGYRLRLGGNVVTRGVLIGLALTAAVGMLTFVSHRKLPYKRMLVITGVMLGGVLLVMVGEQVQEMQLAGWLPTTSVPSLIPMLPAWMGMWFSLFPNLQGIAAQSVAALVVLGSYFVAHKAPPSAGRDISTSRVSQQT